ncbi:MAG: NAD(P)H-hydrate epimerase [Leptolyngbyaceae cyanobacterium T60_A2020_046]|nr:NAD(P)H-hydrate epimerase [Leptolyngbyaceae cyanobacterium T60_A2020_046]
MEHPRDLLSPLRWFTDTGCPVPSVTADQMRELDRIAVEDTGPLLLQMMENAGRNLALLALEHLGAQWRDRTVVVLAGTGGNGGGGICAARHLANRGVAVQLCLTGHDHLHAAAAYQHHIYTATGGAEISPSDLPTLRPDLIVDALLGYSLTTAPRGTAAAAIAWANQCSAPTIALDLPSGLHATTGETLGDCIRAATTLTLALPKTGLWPEKTGPIVLADIGIPARAFQRLGVAYESPFDDRFRVPLRYEKFSSGQQVTSGGGYAGSGLKPVYSSTPRSETPHEL